MGGPLRLLHDVTGGKTDPLDPEVSGFVRGNLHMSPKDAGILLRGVARARERIEIEQARLDEAFEADRPAEETSTLRQKVDGAILESRDEILRELSPRGAKALLRYVAVTNQGMSVSLAR